MSEAKTAEAQAEIPPRLEPRCERPGCRKAAAYTIVLNFWPVDRPRPARALHNAVRMFPGIVACDDHKFELRVIGMRVIQMAVSHVRTLFEKLSLSQPDMGDCLIDLRTIDHAQKMWREPPGHSTTILH